MNELFDKVSGDIKTAMLARDKVALEALRGIKKEFIEAKTAKGGDGNLADDVAVKILQKMVKQRKESAQIYSEQNRPELAENELAEAAVIEKYLPTQMTDPSARRCVSLSAASSAHSCNLPTGAVSHWHSPAIDRASAKRRCSESG